MCCGHPPCCLADTHCHAIPFASAGGMMAQLVFLPMLGSGKLSALPYTI
jgi:hypothetical protein